MHKPWMFDIITGALSDISFDLFKIALVCDRDALIKRRILDNRRKELIEELIESPDLMEPFYHLGAEVIDVSNIPVEEVARRVMHILNKKKGE